MVEYRPSLICNSSSCVPCSTTSPSWRTMMRSASLIVERRCAMTMIVQVPCICCMRESSAACTMASFSASNAEVASSNRRIRGLRTRARAMLRRCFWPPLRSWPLSPTMVLYPSGSALMNSSAFASLAARSTSSMVYSVGRRP
mmetsp:Transcript_52180/g.121791  ORF Transcript_52180/g.121791 Transcript_52180/m.121791 type:complete len:143 (-) Transcript_52180:1916-2344(-)